MDFLRRPQFQRVPCWTIHVSYISAICIWPCCALFCCCYVITSYWILAMYLSIFFRVSSPTQGPHDDYFGANKVIVTVRPKYNNDVIISAMASQITSLTIVYSRRISKNTSKLRVTGLCEGNSPVTGEFPAQRASNAENVSIWWRHHD